MAKVIKNDGVLGGSARPDFVKKHHPTDKVCFCFPVLSWTLFCPPDERISNRNGTFIQIPPSTTTTNTTNATISFLTSSDLSVQVVPSSTTTTTNQNNPKILSTQYSSMISYNKRVKTHYALKSIILDRCSTPELKQELKNEGTTLLLSFVQ